MWIGRKLEGGPDARCHLHRRVLGSGHPGAYGSQRSLENGFERSGSSAALLRHRRESGRSGATGGPDQFFRQGPSATPDVLLAADGAVPVGYSRRSHRGNVQRLAVDGSRKDRLVFFFIGGGCAAPSLRPAGGVAAYGSPRHLWSIFVTSSRNFFVSRFDEWMDGWMDHGRMHFSHLRSFFFPHLFFLISFYVNQFVFRVVRINPTAISREEIRMKLERRSWRLFPYSANSKTFQSKVKFVMDF